jgi:hypothetical protein
MFVRGFCEESMKISEGRQSFISDVLHGDPATVKPHSILSPIFIKFLLNWLLIRNFAISKLRKA